MKKALIFAVYTVFLSAYTIAQTPAAILELKSNSQGFLPPVIALAHPS
ncbi:MAG: hypothetical protein IPL46_08100 [Saprospiraceae bacterium]|nr:hypothetical protein [Saprospiraceae bacterium]